MPQEPGQSMTDALRSDHAAIAAMLRDPLATAPDEAGLAHREELVMTLVRHVVAEEQYLYPTVHEHLPASVAAAERAAHADRALERELRVLEETDLDAQRLADTLAGLAIEFDGHVARQEPLLAELDARCPSGRLLELGGEVRGAEQVAPTSPRRIAAASPGASKLLSVMQGWVDQVRDHYTHRGETTVE